MNITPQSSVSEMLFDAFLLELQYILADYYAKYKCKQDNSTKSSKQHCIKWLILDEWQTFEAGWWYSF